MRAELKVSGENAASAAEAARSLEAWLVGRDELRGRVRPVPAVPRPGEMGSVSDVLVVALGHGGAATAVASVLISWIRRQRGKVLVTAKRSDGAEITVSADHVRGLTAEQISPLVNQVAAALDGNDARRADNGGGAELDTRDAGR